MATHGSVQSVQHLNKQKNISCTFQSLTRIAKQAKKQQRQLSTLNKSKDRNAFGRIAVKRRLTRSTLSPMNKTTNKSEATTATHNAEAIANARKAINRAGLIYINPPKFAVEWCLDSQTKADKAVRDLQKKPADLIRYGRASKAMLKAAKAVNKLVAPCHYRNGAEAAFELISISDDLITAALALV